MLLIEVSVSSVIGDRPQAKAYASADTHVYKIVNLKDRQIDVRTDRQSPAYYIPSITALANLAPTSLKGAHVDEIAVDDIIPHCTINVA